MSHWSFVSYFLIGPLFLIFFIGPFVSYFSHWSFDLCCLLFHSFGLDSSISPPIERRTRRPIKHMLFSRWVRVRVRVSVRVRLGFRVRVRV